MQWGLGIESLVNRSDPRTWNGEKHSNDGEYQPVMHVAPQPMNDLPSPTTPCSVATSEDVQSPRIPLAQSDDVVPGTFDSVTPTQQQPPPNSEG